MSETREKLDLIIKRLDGIEKNLASLTKLEEKITEVDKTVKGIVKSQGFLPQEYEKY